jgi:hypothetical protein
MLFTAFLAPLVTCAQFGLVLGDVQHVLQISPRHPWPALVKRQGSTLQITPRNHLGGLAGRALTKRQGTPCIKYVSGPPLTKLSLSVTSYPVAPQPALINLDAALLGPPALAMVIAISPAQPPILPVVRYCQVSALLLRCILMERYVQPMGAAMLLLARSARMANAS